MCFGDLYNCTNLSKVDIIFLFSALYNAVGFVVFFLQKMDFMPCFVVVNAKKWRISAAFKWFLWWWGGFLVPILMWVGGLVGVLCVAVGCPALFGCNLL